ncbi:unnamed protein product [Rhizophagus irregularis]|nr:unnamed protein product [Rhizophagus irregularis]
MEEKPRNLWESVNPNKHQRYVTTTELEDADERAIYMNDLYKRKQVYGICGECNEPGTGQNWCQPCGFGKIYSAEWPEGISEYWDIENQKWRKITNLKVALKSLDNSSDICSDFLNEIKSHLEIFLYDTIQCFGVTQDPNTKDYMMVLYYCINSSNLSSFQFNLDINNISSSSILEIPTSECLDLQLNESANLNN